jgi:predicted ferric reductase
VSALNQRVDASLARQVRPDRPSWLTPGLVYAIGAANAALIVGFWWASSGFELTHSSSDALNAAGRVTALLGTYLALWQLLLMARVSWLEHALGFEKMSVLHRWNGYATVGLLLGHGVFQTLGYQLGDGKDVAGQLADFVSNYPGLVGAIAGLGLFVAIAVVSVSIARRHLAYETWYFIHLYAYLAIALAFTHQVATGVDFINNPVFTGYWYLLYAVTLGALVLNRVVRPLLDYSRHGFRVQSVVREARGVFSIYITGRDLGSFRAEPGQFAIWRFLDRSRWWQAHPFSISAIPDGRRLRITVKNIGDFSNGVHSLRPGTPVLIEGPFGKFVERPDRDKALLIAGGIGITPIRPLAEELAIEGIDVRVLYRAHSAADVIFKDELSAIAARHQVRVDYLLTEATGRRRARNFWFLPDALMQQVPDIRDRAIYICGPDSMHDIITAGLHALGIPSSQVRTEVFRF